jgi:PAS domain S-box-containing protein
MIKAFTSSQLQRKITLVTMTTSLATLLFALVILAFLESWEFKRSFEQELRSIAGITGGNSIAALEFLDLDAAKRTLSVLKEDPRILGAWLYDANNVEFARYSSGNIPDVSYEIFSRENSDVITVKHLIYHQNKQVGNIVVVANNSQITSRLAEYTAVVVFIAFLSLLLAYFLSRYLRNTISHPILRLAETARTVSQSGDYSLRAEKESDDETGELVQQFNQMLYVVEKATSDLQKSEKQLQTITDSLPVLIAYIDSELRYQFNNAAYEKWFNLTPAELKGRSVKDVIGDEAFKNIEQHLKQAFFGQTSQFESEMEYKHGTRRFISTSLIPHFHEGSAAVLGVFALVVDITDQKEAQAERERLLVSERAARNEAEHASKIKDDFLTTLSHELRTPLNAIVGWSQILLRGGKTEEQIREGISVISRSAKIQAELIADLLDLSRIQTGKLSLDLKPLQLAQVINAALDAVSMAAKSKNIRIISDISNDVKPVRGDSARLQQIIWNLLTNAVKFTPSGGTVTVTAKQSSKNTVEVQVADTGQGIPVDFLPYVFERFRQADSSSTRKYGGLGIGLSLAKQLVEHHGGTISAASAGEGMGATFSIQLPVYDGSIVAKTETSELLPELKGCKILAIDDQADALDLVKRILEDTGATVFVANSALEGLEILKTRRPDIVLTDIGMPDHDGYEFIKWIRELKMPYKNDIPSVALTAFARPEDKERALSAGFQAHVTKPINEFELVSVIVRLISKSGNSAQSLPLT